MTVKHAAVADLGEIAAKVTNLGYSTRPIGGSEPKGMESDEKVHVHMHGDHDHDEEGPWWRTRKAMLTLACGAALVGAYLDGRILPDIGHWAFLVALLVGLVPIGRRAIAGALAGSPFSIETLMSIAAIGAVIIGATEEAATVVLLFLVGELLEGVAASRARASGLSKATMANIGQNITLALGLKAFFLVTTVIGVTGCGRPSWPTPGRRCWSPPMQCGSWHGRVLPGHETARRIHSGGNPCRLGRRWCCASSNGRFGFSCS